MIFNDLDKQCRRTTIYYMNSDHKSSPFVDSCNPTLKKASLPGAFLLLAITLLIATPLATEAKNSKYAFGKSRDYSVSATLGTVDTSDGIFKLSALTVSSSKKIETEINLYDTIAFIRINPARPWHIFSRPKNIDLTISGLTSGKTYYLYQERLRNPDIFVADQNGSHIISLDTPRHRYLVLKTKPSTLHIDASGGQDCNSICSWDQPSLTCILSTTLPINDIIEIDDAGITLDGSNRLITHTNNIGVYANTLPLEPAITGITIKNIRLAGLDVGVALYNTSNVSFENVTVKSDTTGIQLGDTTGVYMFHSTIWSNSTGFITNNNTNIFINRTNWKGNTVDIDPSVGTLDLTSDTTNRGNCGSKNTNCQQTDSAHPNYCTNSYSTGHGVDGLPWACENGWLSSVTCPTVVVPPVGGGTSHIVPLYTQIPSPYPSRDLTDIWSSTLYAFATSTTDNTTNSCGATIEKCGCALVSGVMVIKYFEPTIDVTPVTLNDYLKNPPTNPKTGKPYDGYTPEGGFHYITGVNVFTDGKIKFNNLEYGKPYVNDYAKLDNLLSAGAVVFGRTSKVRGSHYYVIEEKFGDTYKIRDPWYFNTDTLNDDVSTTTNPVYNGRYTKFDYNNDFNEPPRGKPFPHSASLHIGGGFRRFALESWETNGFPNPPLMEPRSKLTG